MHKFSSLILTITIIFGCICLFSHSFAKAEYSKESNPENENSSDFKDDTDMTDILIGEWHGTYYYSDGRNPVDFTIEFSLTDGEISGRIKEQNTFGTDGEEYLFADIIDITIYEDSGRITFTKRYDGTADVSHDVMYSGTLILAHTPVISGIWKIRDLTGDFSMTRQ